MDWQLGIALVVVAAACGYILRRGVKAFTNQSAGCFGCTGCSEKTPTSRLPARQPLYQLGDAAKPKSK